MYEFIPKKYHNPAATFICISEGLNLLVQCAYFSIWNDWRWIHWTQFGCVVLSFLLTFFMPESPKWYHDHKHYDKAREKLAWVAKLNGNKMSEAQISQIVFENEQPTT